MPPETTTIQSESILSLIGLYPALLAFVAVVIGLSSLIVRRNRFNSFAAIVLSAIGCLGFGATAYRLYSYNSLLLPGGMVDPTQWLSDFGQSWMAAGVVLPACGIGLILLALSVAFTKADKPK
tara:strand:+ start:78 stop:446 length:369 start_codon:yes stop_codon:yes gene_type:complete